MILIFRGTMVLILDGSSETGAPLGSNLCYLIYSRHLIRARGVKNWFFSPKIPIFLHAYAICSELPSYIITMRSTRK